MGFFKNLFKRKKEDKGIIEEPLTGQESDSFT